MNEVKVKDKYTVLAVKRKLPENVILGMATNIHNIRNISFGSHIENYFYNIFIEASTWTEQQWQDLLDRQAHIATKLNEIKMIRMHVDEGRQRVLTQLEIVRTQYASLQTATHADNIADIVQIALDNIDNIFNQLAEPLQNAETIVNEFEELRIYLEDIQEYYNEISDFKDEANELNTNIMRILIGASEIKSTRTDFDYARVRSLEQIEILRTQQRRTEIRDPAKDIKKQSLNALKSIISIFDELAEPLRNAETIVSTHPELQIYLDDIQEYYNTISELKTQATELNTNIQAVISDENYSSILITTTQELQAIATNPNYRNARGDIQGSFILGNNINFQNSGNFEPIGMFLAKNNQRSFIGSFDGNSFEIQNIIIDRAGQDNIGLFGLIKNADIKNVKIVGGGITGLSSVGGLVGWMRSGTVTGSCSATIIAGNKGNAGGLVGRMTNGKVTGYNTGDVRSSGEDVGGLVGDMISGTVTGSNSGAMNGKNYVGGLVGSAGAARVTGYNTGSVIAASIAGGLVGFFSGRTTTITGYNTGDVRSSKVDVGGLVGIAYGGTVKGYALNSEFVGGFGYADETVINAGILPSFGFGQSEYAYLISDEYPFVVTNSETDGWVYSSSNHPTLNLNL